MRLADAVEDEAIARKLAALGLGASVYSTNPDFVRFAGVERISPWR